MDDWQDKVILAIAAATAVNSLYLFGRPIGVFLKMLPYRLYLGYVRLRWSRSRPQLSVVCTSPIRISSNGEGVEYSIDVEWRIVTKSEGRTVVVPYLVLVIAQRLTKWMPYRNLIQMAPDHNEDPVMLEGQDATRTLKVKLVGQYKPWNSHDSTSDWRRTYIRWKRKWHLKTEPMSVDVDAFGRAYGVAAHSAPVKWKCPKPSYEVLGEVSCV